MSTVTPPSAAAVAPGHRRAQPNGRTRKKLRNATLVIPATGERSHRQVALRTEPPPSGGLPSSNSFSPSSAAAAASVFRRLSVAPFTPGRRRQVARDCVAALWRRLVYCVTAARTVLCSDSGRDVVKCSLAYLIGSMATFWPPLSHFLGNRDGKHIVATLTVYFHPARTVGSMIEAVLMGVVAVLYAEVVGLLAMAVPVAFRAGRLIRDDNGDGRNDPNSRDDDGIEVLASVIVLVTFVGGALGFVGWVKHRLNSPLSNVASTLASIAIITVVTKEDAVHGGPFSSDKPVQVLKMLVIGMAITTGVNLTVWRRSARQLLRASTVTASESLADMVSAITQSFLDGSAEGGGDDAGPDPAVARVSARYAAAQARTTSRLREAKYEHFTLGDEDIYRLESTMVKALEAVARAVGGLRSANDTQSALLRETPWPGGGAGGVDDATSRVASPGRIAPEQEHEHGSDVDGDDSSGHQEPVRPISGDVKHDTGNGANDTNRDDGPLVLKTPSDILEVFIALLGPSMKSLAWTLSEILRVSPFEQDDDGSLVVTLEEQPFRDSLRDALQVYNASRAKALQELYRSIGLGQSRSEKIQADIEEVAAACGHFSASLLEVAGQIDAFLDVLDELKDRTRWRKRTWRWLRFWDRASKKHGSSTPAGRHGVAHVGPHHDGEYGQAGQGEAQNLLQRGEPVRRMRRSATLRGIPDTMVRRRDNAGWQESASLPSSSSLVMETARPMTPMSTAAPSNKEKITTATTIITTTAIKTASQKAMGALRFLARDDIRFAIKVGIGAVAYGALAFVPATIPIYMHWRGEWGLLSYMIVVSMTKGAANTTGLARFVGTLVGAVLAMAGWAAGQGSAVALAAIGWFVSLVNFYFILVVGNGPMGRISLLCYNVAVLYAYSLSQRVDDDDDDEGGETPDIVEICFHRAVAVTLGILWGIVVCRVIWPISGRAKCREGLAVLYLQLGLIWKRGPLASINTAGGGGGSGSEAADGSRHDDDDGQSLDVKRYMRAGESAALQRYASKIDDLCHAAESEFSLRGPFPRQRYARIMQSTHAILDGLYAMKLLADRRTTATTTPSRLTPGEKALLAHTADERRQLSQRVCHLFHVLASSMMLEYPLVDAVPGIVDVKDRLLGKLYRFRTDRQERSSTAADAAGVVEESDYALLYAYTLVTGQVAHELGRVQREIEAMFGVLREDDDLDLLLQ